MARRSASHHPRRQRLPRNSRSAAGRCCAALAALAIGLLASASLARAQVKADGSSIAIGGTVTNSTISVGIPPEQLVILIRSFDQASETHKKYIAKLEGELDLNQRQLQAAFATLGEVNVPPHELAFKLVEFAGRLKDLQELAGRAKPGEDPKITALRRDSQAALEAGDLDKADASLAEIGAEQRRARERLAVDEAETLADRGKIAMTRLRYRDAARHFGDAAAVLPSGEADDDKRIHYLNRQAEAFFRQGFDFGDGKALQASLEVRTRLVEMTRARNTLDAAKIRFLHAMTIAVASRRDRDSTRLKEAIAAYRALLTEFERLQASFDRAVVHHHLGITLRRAASDGDDEIERLEEAAQAFRDAALGFESLRAKRYSVSARMELIATRVMIDERSEDRTPNLDRALAAQRAVAARLSRERQPHAWAEAQVKIANTLRILGERTNDMAKLEEAVAIYRGALEVVRRGHRPLFWAQIQAMLADALNSIGLRQDDNARLEEAVVAVRAALEERTRERIPQVWAFTQVRLGSMLVALAERKDDTGRLEQAAEAYRAALQEWTAEHQPGRHKHVQEMLDTAVAMLELRKNK